MAFPSKIVAGIDIGNSTTEAILMDKGADKPVFLSSSMTATTGVKGTLKNVDGCVTALNGALSSAGLTAREVTEIRINQAAPVISNLSMDTVSETVVIGSAMIGHNPDTPGGEGLALGLTVSIEELAGHIEEVVAIIDDCPYYRAAALLNKALRMESR